MKEHLSGDASPTERTMAWLREQGYTVDKVEQKVRRNVTRDFMGFADIIAIRADVKGALAVQATSSQHLVDRIKKVMAEPRAEEWVKCGNGLIVVGWSLGGPAGKRKTFAARVVTMGLTALGGLHSTDGYNVGEVE